MDNKLKIRHPKLLAAAAAAAICSPSAAAILANDEIPQPDSAQALNQVTEEAPETSLFNADDFSESSITNDHLVQDLSQNKNSADQPLSDSYTEVDKISTEGNGTETSINSDQEEPVQKTETYSDQTTDYSYKKTTDEAQNLQKTENKETDGKRVLDLSGLSLHTAEADGAAIEFKDKTAQDDIRKTTGVSLNAGIWGFDFDFKYNSMLNWELNDNVLTNRQTFDEKEDAPYLKSVITGESLSIIEELLFRVAGSQLSVEAFSNSKRTFFFDFTLPFNGLNQAQNFAVDESGYLTFRKDNLCYQIAGDHAVNVYGAADESTVSLNIANSVDYEGETYNVSMIGNFRDYNRIPGLAKFESSFSKMKNLKSVFIAPGISTIQGSAFSDCKFLETVILPHSIQIGRAAFSGCSSLTEITIPGGIRVIPRDCFAYCQNLSKVTLEDGIESIDMFAFNECSSLKMILIPASVTNIAANDHQDLVFESCPELTIFGVPGSAAEQHASRFNIPFESIENIEIFESFDPIMDEILNYLQDTQFTSLLNLLRSDGNYCCSIVVNKNAGDPLKLGTQFLSHLIFNGYDGLKEIITSDTSKEAAVDILTNLLSDISSLDADNKVYTMIKDLTKHMLGSIQDDLAISEFKDLMTADVVSSFKKASSKLDDREQAGLFLNLLMDGDSKKITEFLGDNIKNEKTLKKLTEKIDQFVKNGKLFSNLGKALSWTGHVVDCFETTGDVVMRYIQFSALADSSQEMLDLLSYIEKNSVYKPLNAAAETVRKSIQNEFDRTMNTIKPIFDSGLSKVSDEVLDKAVKLIPFGSLIKNAADLGVDIGNAIFHTKDIQSTYDQMKITTYLNAVLSNWAFDKLSQMGEAVLSGNEDEIYKSSRKYYDSVLLLHKSRSKGESIYLNHLDALTLLNCPTKSIVESKKLANQGISVLKSYNKYLYEHKAVGKLMAVNVSCPIDIEILDRDGNSIAIIDGQKENSGFIGDLYYSVQYNSQNQDFDKYFVYPENSGYELLFKGTDLGVVDLTYGLFNEEDQLYYSTLPNIPIAENEKLKLTSPDQNRKLSVIRLDEKNGVSEVLDPVIRDTYVSGESLNTHIIKAEGQVGDRVLLNAYVLPVEATNCDVVWSVADPTIAAINDDGVLILLKEGQTYVLVSTLDGLSREIPVVVVNPKEISKPENPGQQIKPGESDQNKGQSIQADANNSLKNKRSVQLLNRKADARSESVKADSVPTGFAAGGLTAFSAMISSFFGMFCLAGIKRKD